MQSANAPTLRDRFNQLAERLTVILGSFEALAGSIVLVVVWALTGPIFNFSDTWQLFINTTTTVAVFMTPKRRILYIRFCPPLQPAVAGRGRVCRRHDEAPGAEGPGAVERS